MEDIARNPGATIGAITRRTGLAQSLVSRIIRAMADAGAVTVTVDSQDRRKVRVGLEPGTRAQIIRRAGNDIADALSTHARSLTASERTQLERHLSEAERLLQVNAERSDP